MLWSPVSSAGPCDRLVAHWGLFPGCCLRSSIEDLLVVLAESSPEVIFSNAAAVPKGAEKEHSFTGIAGITPGISPV